MITRVVVVVVVDLSSCRCRCSVDSIGLEETESSARSLSQRELHNRASFTSLVVLISTVCLKCACALSPLRITKSMMRN